MKLDQARRALSVAAIGAVLALSTSARAAAPNSFAVGNLVSDLPGIAPVQDTNLKNPWGLSSSSSSPLWVSDNGADAATLYTGAGQPFPIGSPLVVSIPDGSPTGNVFNNGNGGPNPTFMGDRFIFAGEDGFIDGWSGGNTAANRFSGAPGSIYKGLGINDAGTSLYIANFQSGAVDVLNSVGGNYTPGGSFSDPTVPAGFAPFNVQNLGGKVYVTFAKQNGEDDLAGPGNGFVDVLDPTTGTFTRLISQGALNSPWGLAIAPADFGPFAGDLLVGNFGDGTINAFDPNSGAFIDTLRDGQGNPLQIEGLWGLKFGNGGLGGDPDDLYFTAGISGGGEIEDHGLFGEISSVPDSGASTGVLFGIACLGVIASRRKL